MATSGTYTYEATRNKIIEGALRIVQGLGQGDTPTAAQYTEANDALNMIVKALAAQGMPLWAVTETSFSLTTNDNTYTIGTASSQVTSQPKPQKILQAWIRNTSSSVDTPLRIITKYEYNQLGNKATTGRPIQLMYDPGNLEGTIKIFPTPDATTATADQIYIVYQRTFQDFTNTTDTPDFPQEWHEALKYELAVRLAFEYGVPPNDKRDLIAMAKMVKEEALSFGTEEGSLYFQPERRNW